MIKYPGSDEVERELLEIESEFRRLQERKALLLRYRELAAQVISNQKAESTHAQDNRNPVNRNGQGKTNLELVQKILSQHGALPVHTIVLKMRETGWRGSDVDSLDWDRINKMLRNKTNIFEKLGRGLWGLKSEPNL